MEKGDVPLGFGFALAQDNVENDIPAADLEDL